MTLRAATVVQPPLCCRLFRCSSSSWRPSYPCRWFSSAATLPSASNPDAYDVLIIGGGHAGCEAASAAARLGARTCLITSSIVTIGVMSCNPSMGGIGKATLIREVDALGGLMGRMADQACIQFRLLNTSKGAAVHGPRMQIDRELYRRAMQREILHQTPNLTVREGNVEDLILNDESATSSSNSESNHTAPASSSSSPLPTSHRRVLGVVLSTGERLLSSAVVLTTGTFLQGKLFQGRTVIAGGRRSEGGAGAIEQPATKLAMTLKKYQLPLARMKTGTPPRLKRSSLALDQLEIQESQPVQPFSYLHASETSEPYRNPNPLLHCYHTHTTAVTRELVLDSIAKGEVPAFESRPLLPRGSRHRAEQDDSNAPRYCPSLENKFRRFSHHASHHIMLEPEGVESEVIYPQGLGIASSQEYQEKIVRSLPGCTNAQILAYGYSVEYDYLNPLHTHPWLESKFLPGLFLAGQINGTTGYEEAAAQGIIAGINAVRVGCQGRIASSASLNPPTSTSPSSLLPPSPSAPFILPRSSSFIGVLIDDLTRTGVMEPYRMFTSRSEYRLTLRPDNADRRLTRLAHDLGCLTGGDQNQERMRRLTRKEARLQEGWKILEQIHLPRSAYQALLQTSSTSPSTPSTFSRNSASSGKNDPRLSIAEFMEGMAPSSLTLSHLLRQLPSFQHAHLLDASILTDLEIDLRYRHHITRQQREIEAIQAATAQLTHITIQPETIRSLTGAQFSHEDYDKLQAHAATIRNLGGAQSIGLSPTGLARLTQIILEGSGSEKRMTSQN